MRGKQTTPEDLVGQKIDMLTVERQGATQDNGKTMWWCICDCGNKTIVAAGNLNQAKKGERRLSCGCVKRAVIDDYINRGIKSSKGWDRSIAKIKAMRDRTRKPK